jgi:hypothetical protein
LFHFSTLQRSGGRQPGFKVICRYHEQAYSSRGLGSELLSCCREYTAASGSDEDMEKCLHSLMAWCLVAEPWPDRAMHMDSVLNPRVACTSGRELLDRQVHALCDKVQQQQLPHLSRFG